MSNNTGNTLLAIITGAALGAGFGLLYAPQSGKETREKLKEEANKAKDKLGKEYEDITDQVTEFAHEAKSKFENKVNKLFDSANSEVDDILANLEDELEELRNKNAHLEKELEKFKS